MTIANYSLLTVGYTNVISSEQTCKYRVSITSFIY